MELVTREFRDRIEAKVAAMEKTCTLEFVPVIVRASGEYSAYRLFATLLAFGLTLAALPWVPFEIPFGAGAALPFLAAALVYALSGLEKVRRRMVPASVRQANVEREASLHFLREEVFATRARTGVLIFVSLLERAVFILADKGVTAKIPSEEWSKLGARLAADFRRESPGVTFLEALEEIVARSAADFPHGPHDKNELPDRLRQS